MAARFVGKAPDRDPFAGLPILAALLAVPLAFAAAFQPPPDPFTRFNGRIIPGRLQRMVATDQYLAIHRIEPNQEHVLELWAEPDLRILWQRRFARIDATLFIEGDRVVFEGSETRPLAASAGLHVVDAGTGARVHFSRALLVGRASRFIAVSGDHLLDLHDGSEVFGHVYDQRHVRVVASVGSRFLLLVSERADWNTRRLVLYDPATRRDLWADRSVAPAVQEFIDKRVNRVTRPAFGGFPIIFAADTPPRSGRAFQVLLLRENGEGVILDRPSFGLGDGPGRASVDFSHSRASGAGRLLVAGIGSGPRGRGAVPEILAVFDAEGRKLAQTAMSREDRAVAWSGLTPAGDLLLFVNQTSTAGRDLLVTYTLPGLARTESVSAYDAQVNSPPALLGADLFLWDRVPRLPKGTRVPPRTRTQTPVVVSLHAGHASVTSYYPFDSDRWSLMDFASDRIRHVANASHLFLPFQPSDKGRDNFLLLPLPRGAPGWLDASLALEPQTVYVDSAVAVSYSPPGATVSVDRGQLAEQTWRTPSSPGQAVFTIAVGGVVDTFPVEVLARPANRPPVASFVLLDNSASVTPWSPEALFNGQRSYDPDGRVVSYRWDYGDKTPAAAGPYSFGRHTYANVGEYTVTLTVTDDKGSTGSATKTVVVGRPFAYGSEGRRIPPALAGTGKTGYEFEIVTGGSDGAGTDANVYLTLYGPPNADKERVGTREFHLYDAVGSSHDDAFEQNATDVFRSSQGKSSGLPDAAHLDDVDLLVVRHDNWGERPGWHIRSILVRNQSTRKEWFFEPDTWLAYDHAPRKDVVAALRPISGSYSRGVLFGGSPRSWDMTEAGGSVFILKTASGKFYFTSLDRARTLEVFLNGALVGRQYARGAGLVTPPHIATPEWGVSYDVTSLTRPTKFAVRLQRPDSTWEESPVWIFPASWAGYEAEALVASVIDPLRGQTSVLSYGASVRQALKNQATWDNMLTAATAPILSFGAQSMAIFDAPANSELKGTIEECLGLHVADGLGHALKAAGGAVGSAVLGEVTGLLQAMVRAREWGQQIATVTASGAAAAGGIDQLGRLADCDPLLVQVASMLTTAQERIERMFTRLDANDPAGYRTLFNDVRQIGIGLSPQSASLADYAIDYQTLGITDMTPGLSSDNYCLSMSCLLQMNNIATWKSGGIAPCFPANPIYPISDAEKRRDSAAAMTSYEPLWKNITAVAGVIVDIALLRQ